MKMLTRAGVALLAAASVLAGSPALAAKEIIYFPPAYTLEPPRHIIVPDANADALVAAGVAAYAIAQPVGVSPPVTATAGALDFSSPGNSAFIL